MTLVYFYHVELPHPLNSTCPHTDMHIQTDGDYTKRVVTSFRTTRLKRDFLLIASPYSRPTPSLSFASSMGQCWVGLSAVEFLHKTLSIERHILFGKHIWKGPIHCQQLVMHKTLVSEQEKSGVSLRNVNIFPLLATKTKDTMLTVSTFHKSWHRKG